VREGETLFGLAQRYYGDGKKSSAIYQVNRNRLDSPDELPPGTVLLIPDLPQE
jgi:nucleoid-associated protein YgaU